MPSHRSLLRSLRDSLGYIPTYNEMECIMVSKQKNDPARREFTPGNAQCFVATIRIVYDIRSMSGENALERVLDEARCYGAAEIIENMPIQEDFEKASKILHTQRLKEK